MSFCSGLLVRKNAQGLCSGESELPETHTLGVKQQRSRFDLPTGDSPCKLDFVSISEQCDLSQTYTQRNVFRTRSATKVLLLEETIDG